MKTNLIIKYIANLFRGYIFIFLTATIFFNIPFVAASSEENAFTVNNIKVKGIVDLKFSREKYLDKAFIKSFEILMKKILLAKDFNKINNIKLKKIKTLISSFQIEKEKYSKNEYILNLKIFYNEVKVKEFLSKQNISFTQPENISVLFYPVLFVNNEIKNFRENYFYKSWNDISIQNETINFILPLENLDDLSKIVKMKDSLEKLKIESLVNKYDTNNSVFALMDYNKKKLNIYLAINFNDKKVSKNIYYNVTDIKDSSQLNSIIKDLKFQIIDSWKNENLINLSMPLSLNLKFNHINLKRLDNLLLTFKKIDIINKYFLEELDISDSYFKIYYYGNPNKLKTKLNKYGYELENAQGTWQLYINE